MELQITQTRFRMEKMSKFNNRKKCENIYQNVHKIGGAHLQCVNNHYAKFEYKGMKTILVTDYTNLTPSTHYGWKKCLSSTPVKMRKYLSNVHKIGGAHLKCMNIH